MTIRFGDRPAIGSGSSTVRGNLRAQLRIREATRSTATASAPSPTSSSPTSPKPALNTEVAARLKTREDAAASIIDIRNRQLAIAEEVASAPHMSDVQALQLEMAALDEELERIKASASARGVNLEANESYDILDGAGKRIVTGAALSAALAVENLAINHPKNALDAIDRLTKAIDGAQRAYQQSESAQRAAESATPINTELSVTNVREAPSGAEAERLASSVAQQLREKIGVRSSHSINLDELIPQRLEPSRVASLLSE